MLDDAAVQYRSVPNRHFVTNQSRMELPLHMHHTPILDVRPCGQREYG